MREDALSPCDPDGECAPATVEHAAVGAAGQQGRWCGRGGAGLGRGRPLQEGVGVEGLEGDLLETVCFCRGRAGGGGAQSFWHWVQVLDGVPVDPGSYSRRLFLESGTSHSGAANSFSPSELLLCPGSDTEPLDSSLDSRVGFTSSNFPSAVTGKHHVLKQKVPVGDIFFLVLYFPSYRSILMQATLTFIDNNLGKIHIRRTSV